MRQILTGVSVTALLLAAALLNVPMAEPAAKKIPAVAMGSMEILVVERTAAVFFAGLVLLVILERAWRGQLPAEVSGRGVKYADQAATQTAITDLTAVVSALESQVVTLDTEVSTLQAASGPPQPAGPPPPIPPPPAGP